MSSHEFDVAIIGGGLAGATLARQLRLTVPGARVGLFERTEDGGFKVGESTVEIGANYLARRLRLNKYLFQNHLLKHGLRYFFDTAEKDAPIHRMSEIATDGYPFHPSFQLDRQRFDADLRHMNLEMGVDLRTMVTVRNIQIDDAGGMHRFDLVGEQGTTSCRARWVVDASGRSRILGKALGLKRVPIDHELTAAWGRFKGIKDIDSLGPESWRAQVRHTARHLSTNHFCYRGYWIWVIPLRNDVFSVGVVAEPELMPANLRKPEVLREFFESHRGLADLLEGSEMLDAMGYDRISYGAERFYSEHRFGFTGESAAFPDPFYSPGSDFIATENDLLTDLIRRDLEGEDPAHRVHLTNLYDEFMKYRLDATMPIYRGLYGTFGSFDLMRIKYRFDVTTYYNIWVDSYLRDLHLDENWLTEQVRAREPTLIGLENLARMFAQVEQRMANAGTFHRGNLDGFLKAQEPIQPFS